MSSRYGLRLEDIFRQVFREALLTRGVDPDKLRKVMIFDREGVVVPPGAVTDIDMMVSDGECVMVEVKSRVDIHDVWRFIKTVELAEKQEGVKATRLIMLALEADPDTVQYAKQLGITMIAPHE